MEYITEEEKIKVKKMFLFLIKKKHIYSGGHNGFCLLELTKILDEMIHDQQIINRDTNKSNVNRELYFLNLESKNNKL